MIRILQVVTHMNRGGLETMLMNYYRQIDRNRIQFDFLTHRNYDGDYGEEIHALGGRIYHLPVMNPFSRSYLKALGEFFEKHSEYKIVHVHQDCMSAVILKAAKEHGIKVRIAHSHSSSQDKNIKYLIKLFYRKQSPRYATDLMACGEEAGNWMFGGAPFTVLNNAIDAQAYVFDQEKRKIQRKKWGIEDEELLIGHVGRFSQPKNHSFLIEVFHEIQKRLPVKLILVGDGTLRPEIEKKIQTLELQDKVILTGLRTDVSELLQAMDVFVFPSIYEGLPVTLIEAQAAGLPCVISDCIPEECKKTDLIQQMPLTVSKEEWADRVICAAKTPRRNTYKEIVAADFDIVENAKKLQNQYEEMLLR